MSAPNPSNIASGMWCCYDVVKSAILGVDPPSDPPVPMNLWAASVTQGGGFTDTLDADTYGGLVFAAGDYAALSGFLQGSVISTSGAGVPEGTTDYLFWILASSKPLGWTWNGAPIVFQDGGLAVLKPCQTTGSVAFGFGQPDPAEWTLLSLAGYYTDIPDAYDSAGFPAKLSAKSIVFFGAAATATFSESPTEIILTFNNTYLPVTLIKSLSNIANEQIDALAPC